LEIEAIYLNVDNCEESDIITILDEGIKATLKMQDKEKTVYNFKVNNGRYDLTYTPGTTAQKELMKAWGRETKNWVNKKFQVKFVETFSFGKTKKMIFPVPVSL
jgi:hypothetical protein